MQIRQEIISTSQIQNYQSNSLPIKLTNYNDIVINCVDDSK